jgi:uncharacterized protein GlcG (DUF336 family)
MLRRESGAGDNRCGLRGGSGMRRLKRIPIALFVSLCLCGPSMAQGVLMQRELSLDLALQMAKYALDTCKANGFNVSVAVVNRSGQVMVFLRGDNTAPHNAELARRKAYTARTFRRTSADWAKRTEPPAELSQQRQLSEVIGLSGGVPINVGEETIGGLGVSGSTGEGKDEACAKATLSKFADQLK